MTQREPSTSTTEHYPVIKVTSYRSMVCATCLASNRKLFPVSSLQHLVNVCSGIYLAYEDKVCWECKATLSKLWDFKQKATKSYSILLHQSQKFETWSDQDQDILVQSLSTLQLTSTIVAEYLDVDTVKRKTNKPRTRSSSKKTPEITIENEPTNCSGDEKESDTLLNTIVKSELQVSTIECNDSDSDSFASLMELKTIETSTTSLGNVVARQLNEQEMLKAREKVRERKKYVKSEQKCEKCICYFVTEAKYKKHLVLHNESEGKYKCHICELRFMVESALTSHIESHYRHFECQDCGFRHQSLVRMTLHRKRNHDTLARRCGECDAEFRSPRHLKYHVETMHRDRPKCSQCDKEFINVASLKRHMNLHSEIAMVQCDVCNKQYRGDLRLQAHKRIHDNSLPKEAYCAECGIQYKNVFSYHNHLKTTKRHVAPEDLKHECPECGKKFLKKTYVKTHIEIVHLKQANYICNVCNKAFNAAMSLRSHQREKHSGRVKRRNNVCDVCGKCFTKRTTLQEHMNTHVGARPYKCKLCEATFSYHGALYTHTKLVHLRAKRTDKVPPIRNADICCDLAS